MVFRDIRWEVDTKQRTACYGVRLHLTLGVTGSRHAGMLEGERERKREKNSQLVKKRESMRNRG